MEKVAIGARKSLLKSCYRFDEHISWQDLRMQYLKVFHDLDIVPIEKHGKSKTSVQY